MAVRAALGLIILAVEAVHEPSKFLIVSSAATHKVAYTVLKGGSPNGFVMRELIGSGLTNPQGIAVDDFRNRLYVADPALGMLVYYPLQVRGDQLTVGAQTVAVNSVETRWVTVDSVGNVYFTVEPSQKIMKFSGKAVASGATNVAEVIYDGAFTPLVSSPGGIATDNFYVYWTNKASGTQVGSVMKGESWISQNPNVNTTSTRVSALSSNAVKTYGLCFAPRGVLYYTDETSNLYGLKATGGTGAPVTVSAGFVQPRGCASDGDTMYVADKYLNAVYGFPARSTEPQVGQQMLKAVDLEGAYGVAVFAASSYVNI